MFIILKADYFPKQLCLIKDELMFIILKTDYFPKQLCLIKDESMFIILKTDYFTKVTYAFLQKEKLCEISELKPFNSRKTTISSTLMKRKGFHEYRYESELLEITLTVPLKVKTIEY